MERNSLAMYWGCLIYKEWEFYLAATDRGLCHILLPNESFDILESWVAKHFPQTPLNHDQERLAPYIVELDDYFRGKRQIFNFPLDLRGTEFQKDVWKALLNIPYGTTKSYSDIAIEINRPKAVRAVGAANGANPIPIVIPCHRVIGKDGSLTGFRGGLELKKELLKLEGIKM